MGPRGYKLLEKISPFKAHLANLGGYISCNPNFTYSSGPRSPSRPPLPRTMTATWHLPRLVSGEHTRRRSLATTASAASSLARPSAFPSPPASIARETGQPHRPQCASSVSLDPSARFPARARGRPPSLLLWPPLQETPPATSARPPSLPDPSARRRHPLAAGSSI